MLLSLSTALLFLCALSTALPNTNILHARNGGVVGPSAAFQVYSADPDKVMSVGPSNSTGNSTSTMRPRKLFFRGVPFNFHVSQGPDNTDVEDLVVSFAGLPCPPADHGAYSFEFNFMPEAQYTSSGEGQINVHKINGDVSAPTYNNIQAITGSLIGTFELPPANSPDANIPKLIFINQLVCEPTINLLFGLSEYSSQEGAVAYFQQDGMGLRERSGQ